MKQAGYWVIVAWLCASGAQADLLTWSVNDVSGFANAETGGIQVHPDSLVILAALDNDRNLALGQIAVDEYDKTVPLTDGDVSLGSEWISGTPNVFGLFFTVDLGVDRAIQRVHVRAGATALSQPEYFVRGYRIQAARAATPQLWHQLSEERDNRVLNFDTEADATWSVVREDGSPIGFQGRFVRLTVIRQDRSNWITLGEIEVFGTGYESKGWIEDVFTSDREVNVGRVRWTSSEVDGGSLEFRAGVEDIDLSGAVEPYQQETLFVGPEPVQSVRFRADLSSEAPFLTPALTRVEVEYDPTLVARTVYGHVEPVVATKGSRTQLTYTIDVEISEDDWGVDLLWIDGLALDIQDVRVDGRSLKSGVDFTSSLTEDREGRVIQFAGEERLDRNSMVEVSGAGLFVRDETTLSVRVASLEQESRDKFVNWQNGKESDYGSWTVASIGSPPKLVNLVSVSPEPFSPYEGEGQAMFSFVIGNITESADIVLELFTLDGRSVTKLVENGRAREYEIPWDGRDRDRRIVKPGLYLYEVRVAGMSGDWQRGTLAVAY